MFNSFLELAQRVGDLLQVALLVSGSHEGI